MKDNNRGLWILLVFLVVIFFVAFLALDYVNSVDERRVLCEEQGMVYVHLAKECVTVVGSEMNPTTGTINKGDLE